MTDIWVRDDIRYAHSDITILEHVHQDGSKHHSTCGVDGIRRCNNCGTKIILSVRQAELLDLVDAINSEVRIVAILFTVHLSEQVLAKMTQATLMEVGLWTIELEQNVTREHKEPLALALAAA